MQERRRRQEQRERQEQRATGQAGTARPRERSASVSRSANDIAGSIREQRERLRGPLRDDSTASSGRHRVLMPDWVTRTALLGAQGGSTNGSTAATERRALTSRVAAGASLAAPAGVSGWDGVEALYNSTFNAVSAGARGSSTDTTFATAAAAAAAAAGAPSTSRGPYDYLASINADVLYRRDRAAHLMRDLEENPRRRIERFFVRGEPALPDPSDTSGLAWSENGQTL